MSIGAVNLFAIGECVKSGEFRHFFYHNQNTSCILPFMWILYTDTLAILPPGNTAG